MEPLGVQQRLGGQPRPAHAQRKAAGERKPGRVCVPVEHAVGHPLLLHGPRRHGHLIRAGGRVRGDIPAQPHAAVLARQRRNRGRLQRGQQVREQARLLRDVVLVRAFVAGIIGGHQLHGAQNGGRRRAVRLDGKALHGHARRGVVRTVYELHRGAGARQTERRAPSESAAGRCAGNTFSREDARKNSYRAIRRTPFMI